MMGIEIKPGEWLEAFIIVDHVARQIDEDAAKCYLPAIGNIVVEAAHRADCACDATSLWLAGRFPNWNHTTPIIASCVSKCS